MLRAIAGKFAWIAAVFLIPALALPMPLLAQAYGNLFLPALLLALRPGGDASRRRAAVSRASSYHSGCLSGGLG